MRVTVIVESEGYTADDKRISGCRLEERIIIHQVNLSPSDMMRVVVERVLQEQEPF